MASLGDYLSQLATAPAQARAQQTIAQGNINAAKTADPLIQNAWTAQSGMYGPEANELATGMNNLNSAASDTYWSSDPSSFNADGSGGGNSSYDSKISDYLNPQMQFTMNRGVNALDSSAAASGELFSTGHGNEINNYAQGVALGGYQDAFNNKQTTRNNAYQQYSDFIKNQQARRQGQVNNAVTQTGIGQEGTNNLSNQRTAYDSANIQNKMDQVTTQYAKTANQQQNANNGEGAALGAIGAAAAAGGQAAASYYGAGG